MLKKIFSLTAAALLLFACTDDEWPAQPDWSQIPNPDEEVDDGLLKPAACTNNIVAHRGLAPLCHRAGMLRLGVRHLLDEGRQRRRGPCRRQVPDQRDAPVGAYAGRTARGRRTLQRRTAALAGRFSRRGDEGGMPHAVVARHQEHHLSLDADRVCDQRRAPFVRDRDGDGGETFRGVHLHRKHHRDEVGIRLCRGGRHTDRLDEQPPGRRIRRTGVFLGQPLGGELHVSKSSKRRAWR